MTTHRSAPHRRDEEGAALVLALVFLLLFSLAVPALLGLAYANLGQAVAVEDRTRLAYAADGAIEVAVATLRAQPTLGVDGGPSCDRTPTANGVAMLVTCRPKPGSGQPIVVPGSSGSSANTPGHAVFVTGDGAGDGLEKASNSDIRVGGSVHSRGRITVQAASNLHVVGDARARLGCDADRIVVTGIRDCAAADVPPPIWAPDLTSLPARASVPACTPGATLTLQPGWYDDATTLNAASNCSNAVVHLLPGSYYLDFTVGTVREWSVTSPSTTVVAGTLVPGPTPTCNPAGAGVSLTFGGESRLRVADGRFTACAPPHPDRQRIAIHGLAGSAGGTASTTSTTTATAPTTVGWTPVPLAAGPTAGSVAGDGRHLTTTATQATTRTTSHALALELPTSAVVERAVVRVTHRATPLNRTEPSVLALATATGAPGPSTTMAPTTAFAPGELDVTAWFTAQARPAATPGNDRYALTATWSVRGSHNSQPGTYDLDGLELLVTHRVQGLRALTGCHALAIGAPGACSVLSSVGSPTRLVVRGTVYAPTGTLDLQATNQTEQLVDRGVVARSIRLTITASAPAGYEMVAVPAAGGSPPVTVPTDREVVLEACPRDPASGACARRGDGSPDVRLVAEVAFRDASGGGRAEVLRWTVR